MTTRRTFLGASLQLAAGAAAGASPLRAVQLPLRAFPAAEATRPPMRFIFLHRGNGLWPKVLVPPSFDEKLQKREKRGEAIDVDLDGHELPAWLAPLQDHVADMTLLQGLSGKMCTHGHHSWCSSLGVYKANERISSILWATVDFELAKLFPSPVGHIELACFPTGGGNPRGGLDGIAKGFSARGPQQPNYAFGSPRVALQELFRSVSADRDARARYKLDRELLAFVARGEGATARAIRGSEKAKVANYVDALEGIRERNRKVDAMAERIREHVPKLDPRLLRDDITTIERQLGQADVLLGALISGLTNVAAFTLDELGHPYTGIRGIEGVKVNMHDVGHNKSFGGVKAPEIRARARTHHMEVVDRIARRLKSVPEGDGVMFDNTMLFYFPDGGETHHSHGTQYPFVVLAGKNTKVDLRRRYIRLPAYGKPGHKTLGNWFTTLLNAYGNPVEHYGAPDVGLNKFGIDQRGPIRAFL